MEVLGPWFGSFLIMIKRSIGDYTYNLFQNQKSTTCWIMLAEKKKSLE
jgi:hypothetical protein